MVWKDKWLNQTLQQDFPECYSFAKNKSISVSKAFSLSTIFELFNLPLSQIAFDQVQILQQLMDATNLENNVDIWAYTGGSTKFSSRMYKMLIGHHQTDPTFRGLEKLLPTKTQSFLLVALEG